MRLQVGKTDEAALGKWVAFSFYEAEKEKEKKKRKCCVFILHPMPKHEKN